MRKRRNIKESSRNNLNSSSSLNNNIERNNERNLNQKQNLFQLTFNLFYNLFQNSKENEIFSEEELFGEDENINLSEKNNNENNEQEQEEEEEEEEEEEFFNNNQNNNIKHSDLLTTPIFQLISGGNLSPSVSSITPSNVPFQTSPSTISSLSPSSSSSSLSSSTSSSSSSLSFFSNSSSTRPRPRSSSTMVSEFSFHLSSFLRSDYVQSTLSHYRLKYLEGDNDLYYTLRTQPFSSGIYLRGLLVSGFNNTLFHLYDLFILITSTDTFSDYYLIIYRLVFMVLFVHVIFNLLCIPSRLILHYICWRNSRVIDAETASIAIQDLIHSNIWMMNRILAWIVDFISISTLIFGQLFLWFDDNSSPIMTSLILNICSTDILSFLIRLLIIAIYLLSFREFRDNSGIRNRGMSNFDLDRMATFIFSKEDEGKHNDCSICLQPYEIGEVLTTLPCHERHCFHAACVKEWLKRQNACPLCQKICEK